jgi:CubicO group peptidase (beta-lactamase class C family)
VTAVLTERLNELDACIEAILRKSRAPGIGLAVVANDCVVCARGFGHRDRSAGLPMTGETIYPIASTSKAMNAVLLGMLVDEGRVAWDAPVQRYLPGFRLGDELISSRVTLRDLVTMRTGLPRHDWLWTENVQSRTELVSRLGHLELSTGFRERFQYNNLTVTAAGHVAERVTGQSWEELVEQRIFNPLGMRQSTFSATSDDRTTLAYHESIDRELLVSRRFATEVTAPSGGSIHSHVCDMAQWMLFNLHGTSADARPLLRAETLREIHSPQIVVPASPAARKPNSTYALGWTVDHYQGRLRLSHGGYLHDVNSEIVLFPAERVGILAFTNFGPPMLALLVCEQVAELLMGIPCATSLEARLSQYERQIEDNMARIAAVARIPHTKFSHAIADYCGTYVHAGYGSLEIHQQNGALGLRRNDLVLALEHWHYDAWTFRQSDLFAVNEPNPFDRASHVLFEADAQGAISALSIRLEPAVAAIRFTRSS